MAKVKRSFPERTHLLIAAAVVALFLFSGWMMRRGAPPVRAEQVTRQQIASFISTNGRVEPVQDFEPHATAQLPVKSVSVHEGDHVKAGQLLIQLDDAEARAQAAKALAELRAAEADLHAVQSGGTQEEILTVRSDLSKAEAERNAAQRNLEATLRLQQNGAASPGEVEAARNRLQKAEADLQLLKSKQTRRFSTAEIAKVQASADEARAAYAAAQEALRNSHITAPFAGTVYQVRVKAGSFVNAGDLLLQMADLNRIQVRAFVDEPDIGKLAKDQKVEVTWEAIPGRTWEGTLTRIPTAVTTVGTRSVGEITCEIPNPDHKLLPNVNVNVNIVTARHEGALTVPREAVHDIDGRHVIYEIEDGKIRTREVQTGTSSLTRVEILSGVSEGTRIALGAINAQPLRNGMEVKVVER
ncbi:MAG TPA: efflux RND transporter periplasmic adaptor subunit [Candidatus Angelobacter sp.]|nr:efflux RND transporter periplasmic adaptor subunit [Candidatus Angelobacter sp.]